MKSFLIVLLWLSTFVFQSDIIAQTENSSLKHESDNLNQIRKLFYESVENEVKLEELENLFENKFSGKALIYNPTLLAYSGAIEALKAKHAFNPFKKFNYVLSSLEILERAVKRDEQNLEIRFIRFSILHNLPGIFGYSKERKADVDEIVSQLSKKDYVKYDPKLQKYVIEFMLESERLNDAQTRQLKKLAVALASNE